MDNKVRQKLKIKIMREASRRLIANHKEEYTLYYKIVAEEMGLTRKNCPTCGQEIKEY
jgi:hypothetical protein